MKLQSFVFSMAGTAALIELGAYVGRDMGLSPEEIFIAVNPQEDGSLCARVFKKVGGEEVAKTTIGNEHWAWLN